jgi:hypothetical protein
MEQAFHTLHQQVQQLQAQLAAQPQPAQPPPARLKPSKPHAFAATTKDRGALEEWIFSVDNYLEATGDQGNDQERIAFAGSLLTGNALVWFRQNRPIMREVDYTYADFKTDMRGEFTDVNAVANARTRLDALQQTGAVRHYNAAFRTLLLQIPDLSDGDTLHRYKAGLKPAIKREVDIKNPADLPAAMALADKLDSVDSQAEQRPLGHRSGVRYTGRATTHYGPTPMELGAFRAAGRPRSVLPHRPPPRMTGAATRPFGPPPPQQHSQQQRTRLTQEERDYLLANGGCVYCRKMGHTVDQCRARATNPNNLARPSLQPGNGFRRRP